MEHALRTSRPVASPARPAMTTMLDAPTVPDSPAAKAKGTVRPSAIPITTALSVARHLGAAEILHKPFTQKTVLEAIERTLRPPAGAHSRTPGE